MTDKLTDATVRKALAPLRGQTILWDGETKGFGLRITPAGAKAFILDFRSDGRQRRMTIGRYPDWTIQAARNEAKRVKRLVNLGDDPMAERHAERGAPTIEDLWNRYQRELLPTKAERSKIDKRFMWKKIILRRSGKPKLLAIPPKDTAAFPLAITVFRELPCAQT